MDHSEKVDQDAVLRARMMLLGSGRLELGRQVEAYRVLSAVSPLTYLPKLAEALLSYGYAQETGNLPEVQLARRVEAVAAARAIDEENPKKTDLLVRTLDACRHQLYLLGRRAEGFAVCEEMAEAGTSGFELGQVKSPLYGHGPLMVVLAEEGRYREAADLCEQMVRSEHGQDSVDPSFWDMVEWVAALDASGRHEAAVEVFAELVDDTRVRCAEDRTSLAILTWELVHLAGLLDGVGRRADAVAARLEALALLTELDLTGNARAGATFTCAGARCSPCPAVRRSQCRPRVRRARLSARLSTNGRPTSSRPTSAACRPSKSGSRNCGRRRGPIRTGICRNWSPCTEDSRSGVPSTGRTGATSF